MKVMTNSAYNCDKNEISICNAIKVNTCLEEVRNIYAVKCDSEIDDIQPSKPIETAVSYDGTWQKRGFTSKYGIGCCIEITTGLVIDFHILSKFRRTCEMKQSLLGGKSKEFDEWYINHKPKCQ